jgi:preprotein translocase subunit SecF
VFELIRPGTNYDFISKWKLAMIASGLLILAGVVSAVVNGVRWGIDFAGGTELQVHFAPGVQADEGNIRSAVESLGIGEPSVVRYGEIGADTAYLIRFQGAEEQGEQQNRVVDQLRTTLEKEVGPVTVDRVEFVGPKVGAELRTAGIKAMAIAFLLILVYVGFRFTPQFAPGGVFADIHDVFITCAVWQLFGQQFDLQVLAALLAIIGYSINDTIVIFDRIREVMGTHTSHDLPSVINQAVNETLSRTILTSGATMLSVIALLVLGGDAIFPFAATMAIGIVAGTFSSIYIASPIMMLLENRSAAKKGAAAKAAGKTGGKRAKARA